MWRRQLFGIAAATMMACGSPHQTPKAAVSTQCSKDSDCAGGKKCGKGACAEPRQSKPRRKPKIRAKPQSDKVPPARHPEPCWAPTRGRFIEANTRIDYPCLTFKDVGSECLSGDMNACKALDLALSAKRTMESVDIMRSPPPPPLRPDTRSLYSTRKRDFDQFDVNAAMQYVVECIDKNQYSALCFRSLGILYAAMGHWRRAVGAWWEYLNWSPNAADADALRALIEERR